MRFPVSLLLFLPALAGLQAQHGSSPDVPFSTPEDQAMGERSFRSQCAACHAPDASGGVVGPSLSSGTFKHGGSDEALFRVITKGVPGTAMTAFPLGGREVWQIIAFLRAVNIGKAAQQAKGDAAKGEQVFNASGCARCHTNGKTGGFAGPDLSEIGSHRSLAQLESSILDPDADVAPDYWSLRAKTKSGQTITGIRMNEDMTSFQIKEQSGRLRSVMKTDLASYDIVRKSPMPSFKGKVSAGDLDDLVAYLASLRAQTKSEEQAK
ncbi:MAG TPA: c-type cytochrome [Bryobacteraceae bacterium]|jgi:putative heme-binding domain-containing protein|nr:c-type cytochrome [Bryobacteraceae bacterium]